MRDRIHVAEGTIKEPSIKDKVTRMIHGQGETVDNNLQQDLVLIMRANNV